ncbi:2-oxo acid dehydrogenase subunit E2 [Alicyclobacillaceae bacterium I2511]|nr:2-oxo acid dehydrogenase subunit E2 [Alicyclobacillaceae bacterium I2511]
MADIKMPQLGESVTEGTLSKWLKQPGDAVDKYEPLAEVITDKVTAEIPADVSGYMEKIMVSEGATVSVGTVLCRIREIDNTENSVLKSASLSDAEDKSIPNGAHPNGAQVVARTTSQLGGETASSPRYSPAVLRSAQDHGIDLREVSGSGEGGRITRKDVLRRIEARKVSANTDTTGGIPETLLSTPVFPSGNVQLASEEIQLQTEAERHEQVSSPALEDVKIVFPTPLRRIIAKRMVESKHTAPHAWTMVEVDVTGLVSLRTQIKQDFKRKEGIDLTYLPFFIKAVTDALKAYPMLNSAWVEDKIHMYQRINISVAVATDDALAVPVIHDADRLSIVGIAHALNELVAQAHSGRLSVHDVAGGTFTVNNTGAFGSVLSAPILNGGQAAILSVEKIVKRPVVIQESIAIRSMVNLSLSLDHRLLDGWIVGQFLQAVKERVESFREGLLIY